MSANGHGVFVARLCDGLLLFRPVREEWAEAGVWLPDKTIALTGKTVRAIGFSGRLTGSSRRAKSVFGGETECLGCVMRPSAACVRILGAQAVGR